MSEERDALVLCLSFLLLGFSVSSESWLGDFNFVFCLGMFLFTFESKNVFHAFVVLMQNEHKLKEPLKCLSIID